MTDYTRSAAIGATTVVDEPRPAFAGRVSWGAILAGAVVALVVQLILAMIGIGVGLTSVSAASGDNPGAGALSVGAGLWWAFSGIFAAAAGGTIAGRLSARPTALVSGLHGLTAWAVSTLVVVYLLTSAVGALVGGAFSTVGAALGGAGQAIGGTVRSAAQAAGSSLPQMDNPLDAITGQIRQATGGQDPAALRDTAAQAVRAALTGDPAQRQAAQERAAAALAQAQSIPVDQARQQVQGYVQQYDQTVAQVRDRTRAAAEATRKAAAQGALYAALALLLGALAAYLCGHAAAPEPTFDRPLA